MSQDITLREVAIRIGGAICAIGFVGGIFAAATGHLGLAAICWAPLAVVLVIGVGAIILGG